MNRNGPDLTNTWFSRISTCKLQNFPRAAIAFRRSINESSAKKHPHKNEGQCSRECMYRNSMMDPTTISVPASMNKRKVTLSRTRPRMVSRRFPNSTIRARYTNTTETIGANT